MRGMQQVRRRSVSSVHRWSNRTKRLLREPPERHGRPEIRAGRHEQRAEKIGEKRVCERHARITRGAREANCCQRRNAKPPRDGRADRRSCAGRPWKWPVRPDDHRAVHDRPENGQSRRCRRRPGRQPMAGEPRVRSVTTSGNKSAWSCCRCSPADKERAVREGED